MTRVLMFVPCYPPPIIGGLEKQAHELARALVATGQSVRVLTGRFHADQPENQVVDGVSITRLRWPASRLLRIPVLTFAMAWTLAQKRSTYDVVHLHQHSWVSLFARLMARLLGKPVLMKMANIGPEHGLPEPRAPLAALARRIVLSADALVAMAPASRAELLTAGYPEAQILLTPNGLSPGSPPDPRRDDGAVRVVFVGRLTPQKRLDLVIEAWRTLDLPPERAVLEFWGDGPLEACLKAVCAAGGLEERIRFRGHVCNVRGELVSADVFVLASDAEGNSNALLEAMAAGLPIVATRVGGAALQVGPEGEPLLVPPGDVAALAEALHAAITDPALRRRIGVEMRKRILAHFDIAHVARTYASAYAALASGRREEMGRISDPVVMGLERGS